MFSNEERRQILRLAREAIRHGLAEGRPPAIDPKGYLPALGNPGASFVTLHLNGDLRGCIGTLEAHRPLVEDIVHNAYAAAFSDPRFHPLTEPEFQSADIDVSILTPPAPLAFLSEADALRQLRPGIDGLILQADGRRATFLPAVWESLPEPRDFLLHLKYKAGLPADYWSDRVQLQRYTVEAIGEHEA